MNMWTISLLDEQHFQPEQVSDSAMLCFCLKSRSSQLCGYRNHRCCCCCWAAPLFCLVLGQEKKASETTHRSIRQPTWCEFSRQWVLIASWDLLKTPTMDQIDDWPRVSHTRKTLSPSGHHLKCIKTKQWYKSFWTLMLCDWTRHCWLFCSVQLCRNIRGAERSLLRQRELLPEPGESSLLAYQAVSHQQAGGGGRDVHGGPLSERGGFTTVSPHSSCKTLTACISSWCQSSSSSASLQMDRWPDWLVSVCHYHLPTPKGPQVPGWPWLIQSFFSAFPLLHVVFQHGAS